MSRDIEDGPDPHQGLVRRGFLRPLGPPGGLPVLPLLVWILLIGLLLVGKGLPTAMDELVTSGGLTGMFGAVVSGCHAV